MMDKENAVWPSLPPEAPDGSRGGRHHYKEQIRDGEVGKTEKKMERHVL